MSAILGSKLAKGKSLAEILPRLNGLPEAGRPLVVTAEERAVPYLDHVLEGWVDGPPTSVVAWVLSAKDPADDAWRRFTLAKIGPWAYELGVFPTPFGNGLDPLAPGIPPHGKRVAH